MVAHSQNDKNISLLKVLVSYLRRPKYSIAFMLTGVILWAVMQPQQFISLWLTGDQQAMLLFNQSKYEQAALKFNNRQWHAFSQYADENFELAAQIWQQDNSVDGLFAQANALAHARNYYQATSLYQAVLKKQPQHPGAKNNLHIVEPLIKLAVSAEESDSPLMMDPQGQQLPQNELPDSKTKLVLTSKQWLKQVNVSPSIFLKKKFFIENYEDRKRKAIEAMEQKQ